MITYLSIEVPRPAEYLYLLDGGILGEPKRGE